MGRTRDIALGLSLLLTASLIAADTTAPAPKVKPIALVGALIRTQTDAGEFIGTIVVRDGKIEALGTDVPVPPDASRIDVSRHVITPGLIDSRGTLGLNPAAAREQGRDGSLDILDAVDPFADDWRDAARQGVTAVYVQPHGSLGGAGAVLGVGPAETSELMMLRRHAAVQAALGGTAPAAAPETNPLAELLARFGIQMPATPAAPLAPVSNTLTRYAQYEQLRGQFDAAKRYGDGKPTRREPPKDLLYRSIKKEIPLRLEVSHEDDIRNALKLTADFRLRTIFEHVDRIKVIPDEFTAVKAPLVLGPFLGNKPSAAVRKLALDGRRWAIGTFSDEPRATAGLRLHAAAAVAAGYPREDVLRSITSNAADLLGVGDKLGRLAAGRPADLVVFAGDPLDASAPVRMTISQGIVTYENSKAEIAPPVIAVTVDLPEKLPPSYALKTTRLLGPSGEFSPGELFIIDGRLSAGRNGGAMASFDVGDAAVTAGLVAGHLVVNDEKTADADAGYFGGLDGVAADDAKLRTYRDAGFLTVVAGPGSSNVIAGWVEFTSFPEIERGAAGFKYVLTAAARHSDRHPVSLAGQVEFIRNRFRHFQEKRATYLPPPVAKELQEYQDVGVGMCLDNLRKSYFEVQNSAEIRAALRLMTDYDITRSVLVMAGLPEDVMEDIRKADVAVVLGPQRPTDSEAVARRAVALGKAQLPLAFGGDANSLRTSAAWLVNFGLPRTVARRALLGYPTQAYGLAPGTAQLAPGDRADFVVWDGDPIDTASRPAAVVVSGQRIKADSSDTPAAGRRPTTEPPARTRRR